MVTVTVVIEVETSIRIGLLDVGNSSGFGVSTARVRPYGME